MLLTLKGHGDWVNTVAFASDGHRVLTGSADQTARVWESASAEQVARWRKEEQAAPLSVAAQERGPTAGAERNRALRAQDPAQSRSGWFFSPSHMLVEMVPTRCGRNKWRKRANSVPASVNVSKPARANTFGGRRGWRKTG